MAIMANDMPEATGLYSQPEQLDMAAAESNSPEPLAIVGMAFRFPAGAVTEDSFWDMLVEKHCASSEFPAERMNIDAFYTTDRKKSGTVHTKKAHFLEKDIREFDASFFSIPPSEAGSLDPCQRGLMETVYHALENAGIPMASIAGSNTSVHVGCFSTDYLTYNLRDVQRIPKYAATGTSQSILANRISWFFNLRGTSMTVDTACSSGMVALDLACQGLWSGRSDTAIVAAANLILSPELNISLSNMNFLSPDGKCYSFDHRGSGYARGEGFVVFVVKPLSKALRDGDTIRSLIRSVASNQDGHTSGGITQPSKDQQAQLIRETYQRAGLDMSKTRFFEAHGTGTAVGDPIEARAIGESFGKYRSNDEPLYVGAVKSNVGHLEGSSGLAGMVKTILAMERGVIPPNTNFEELNPAIDDEFFHLKFPQKSVMWPAGEIRRASVNSFGFGGSNAHVILDDVHSYLRSRNLQGRHCTVPMIPELATLAIESASTGSSSGSSSGYSSDSGSDSEKKGSERFVPQLFILSASDESGNARQAEAHSAYLQSHGKSLPKDFLSNYAYTLATRRTNLPWHSFCVVESASQLADLPTLLAKPTQGLGSNLNLGFVFTGQGAQWHGMGRELLVNPIFSHSFDKSQEYLDALGCRWSLLVRLTSSAHAASIGEAQFSQVLTTAVQLALIDLVKWLGIKPSVVVGHSSGEIAAAYAAGHISHASAIKVSYYRGLLGSRLEETSPTKHSMAAIGLSREQTEAEIRQLEEDPSSGIEAGSLTVSCINSPFNVTVSGKESQLDVLVDSMSNDKIFARKLKVGLGYHSPQMKMISDEYLSLLGTLEPGTRSEKNHVPMVSSVTGSIVDTDTVCNGEYWVRNMVSPVNFLGAMQLCNSLSGSNAVIKRLDRSHGQEIRTNGWLEIGPHSALRGPTREILKSLSRDSEVIYTSALVRNKSALSSLLAAGGMLHCQNFKLDLSRVTSLGLLTSQINSRMVLPNLPRYVFNHSVMHWEESLSNKNFRLRQVGNHDLLGTRMGDPNASESQWKFIIKEDEMPWVADHKVNGSILYPAAGSVVMAIEAAKQLSSDNMPVAFELENVEFPAPIMITGGKEGVEVRIHMSATNKGGKGEVDFKFRIFLYKPDGTQETVSQGTIRAAHARVASDVDDGKEATEKAAWVKRAYDDALATCTQTIGQQEMYQTIRDEAQLEYGPAFQPLDDVHFDGSGQAIATMLPWEGDSTTPHTVHPSRLDGVFQLGFTAFSGLRGSTKTFVPTRIGRAWIPVDGFGHVSEERSPEKVLIQTKAVLERVAIFDVRTLSDSGMQIKTEIEDLELTAVSSNNEAPKTMEDAKYVCSSMEWKVDLDTLSNTDIEAHCEATRSTNSEQAEWFQNMHDMAFQFGARALKEVDEQGAAIAPSKEKYAAWLRKQIGDAVHAPLMSDDELNQLCNKVLPSARAEMHITMGHNLVGILTGTVDALQLLFSDNEKIGDFYHEMTNTASGMEPFAQYLDCLVHKTPNLRFLEVGAGTASTTTTILKTLADPQIGARFEDYTFTDLSPSFFDKARERIQVRSRMNYQVLNVEQDPASQGYDEGAYDVIIADNVLHATHDLRTTLSNVRKLLKPGGKFILKEITTPEALLTGFIFGLLPGWWLAAEPERQMSPCVQESEWNALMQTCNFSGTDLVFRDHLGDECHQWSIMVATATEDRSMPVLGSPTSLTAPKLVIDHDSVLQSAIAKQLSASLSQFGTATTLDLHEAAALSTSETGVHDFIFLDDIERSILRSIEEPSFISLQDLLKSARSILWVRGGGGSGASASPDFAITDGLFRVLRHENNKVALVSLALENTSVDSSVPHISKLFGLMQDGIHENSFTFEPEYSEFNGKLCVNRLSRAKVLDEHVFKRTERPIIEERIGEQKLKLGIRQPGLLDTIEWSEDELFNRPLAADEVDVEVHGIGVNFKDCLTLLGRVNSDILGSESAGIIRAVGSDVKDFKVGDRVAVGGLDSFKTYTRASIHNVISIPDSMTYAEAAGIPTAYCTAYFCLFDTARLRKGEKILIHAASGGTGQAAVQLAQYLEAEVFATVGSYTKKKLLMDIYGIPEDHIFYSRDASFADGVKRMTNGYGVDVVLNSLSGRLLEASWDCIAPFGRFVEIGLKDAFMRGQLPMFAFTRSATFSAVDLGMISVHKEGPAKRVITDVLNLFERGKLKVGNPLHIYPLEETEKAFRFLQSGKSSGKIVLTVNREASLPVVQGPSSKFTFPGDATYVIAGGLGGIGRSMASWLVSRGARNLILLSRSGPDGNERAQEMIAEMRGNGVTVECPACDIADLAALREALAKCSETMPPVKGCFQAAMVLRDTTFSKMSISEWRQSTCPKVQGSWNLHRVLPSGMDFFVLLSSCCGIFGNGGQSNYAAGNTYEDAFARYRVSIGEKAVSLDLGIVLGEGFVAENKQIMDRLLRLDLLKPNTLAEIFAMLDYYCNPEVTITPAQSQIITGLEMPADIVARGVDVPTAMQQPLFRYMQQVESSCESSQSSTSQIQAFKTAFTSAESPAEGSVVVSEALRAKLSRVLGLTNDQINLDHSLETYGVDSLVGLELRNWLAKEMGADLAVFEILGGATLKDIGMTVAAKSTMRPERWNS